MDIDKERRQKEINIIKEMSAYWNKIEGRRSKGNW